MGVKKDFQDSVGCGGSGDLELDNILAGLSSLLSDSANISSSSEIPNSVDFNFSQIDSSSLDSIINFNDVSFERNDILFVDKSGLQYYSKNGEDFYIDINGNHYLIDLGSSTSGGVKDVSGAVDLDFEEVSGGISNDKLIDKNLFLLKLIDSLSHDKGTGSGYVFFDYIIRKTSLDLENILQELTLKDVDTIFEFQEFIGNKYHSYQKSRTIKGLICPFVKGGLGVDWSETSLSKKYIQNIGDFSGGLIEKGYSFVCTDGKHHFDFTVGDLVSVNKGGISHEYEIVGYSGDKGGGVILKGTGSKSHLQFAVPSHRLINFFAGDDFARKASKVNNNYSFRIHDKAFVIDGFEKDGYMPGGSKLLLNNGIILVSGGIFKARMNEGLHDFKVLGLTKDNGGSVILMTESNKIYLIPYSDFQKK